MTLQERLRHEAQTLRTKSMPLKHLIPLLQQAADALDAKQQERKPHTEADVHRILYFVHIDFLKEAEEKVRSVLGVPAP